MSAGYSVEPSPARPLPTILFGVGVGLAPVAASLLLIGEDGGVPLRVGVLLVLLVALLIGVSVHLRATTGHRQWRQVILAREMGQLRDDLRADIGDAIRLSQRAQNDRSQQLQEQIEVLRGQLDALRAGLARATAPPTAHPVESPYGGPVGGYRTGGEPGWPRPVDHQRTGPEPTAAPRHTGGWSPGPEQPQRRSLVSGYQAWAASQSDPGRAGGNWGNVLERPDNRWC